MSDVPPFVKYLNEIAGIREIDRLLEILHSPDEESEVYTVVSARLLLTPGGVDAMYEAMWELPKLKGSTAVLTALWFGENGLNSPLRISHLAEIKGFNEQIDEVTAALASKRLHDLLAESLMEPSRFFQILQFAYMQGVTGMHDNSSPVELAKLLSTMSIRLTRPLLDSFEALIASEGLEREYQTFLAQNPVILDPLAAEVFDQQRLGAELITDYVIRRHDGRYIAVEIERPSTSIFTKSGNFSAAFTHAFGQALDFVGWVDSNVSYAQNKLEGIEAPSGLLVIGLRAGLTDSQAEKLRRFGQNSRRIEIVTFDDLLNRSRDLYSSIHW